LIKSKAGFSRKQHRIFFFWWHVTGIAGITFDMLLLLTILLLLYATAQQQQLVERTMVDETKGHTIVAFGDSLTAGYWKVNRSQLDPFFHSYAHKLRTLLLNASKVVEVGLSGERTDEMLFRLPAVLKQHAATKLVIILGGTNDLAYGRMQASDIVENVKQLHRMALNCSAFTPGHHSVVYTIAVTLPPSQWTQRPPHATKRLAVNDKIRSFANRCAARVGFLDLEPTFDLNAKDTFTKFYSPDGLHLNPHGYDTFAELLHKTMSSFAVKDPATPFSLDCLKE